MKLPNSVPSQVNVRIIEIEQTLQLEIRDQQYLSQLGAGGKPGGAVTF